MTQRSALGLVSVSRARKGNGQSEAGMFEQQFMQQLIIAFTPKIRDLIKEVIADEAARPLIVDYEEAGRMIGTTYEGVRKLVRKGGRHSREWSKDGQMDEGATRR